MIAPISRLDISAPAFKANPFGTWRMLRDKTPVVRIRAMNRRDAHYVTRHDDVAQLLQDERLVKNPANIALDPGEKPHQPTWVPGFAKPLRENMLDLDDPQHARLRALIHKAFTPRMVDTMRVTVARQAEALVARIQAEIKTHGRSEYIGRFALQLPVQVICDLLGVPANERHQFHGWARAITSVNGGLSALFAIPGIWRLMRYLRRLIEAKRARPGDDLTSALVRAEENGDRLDSEELLAMMALLLIAGHETTVNLLGVGALALMQNPAHAAQLRANPALMRGAVEELLRYCSPVDASTERYAAQRLNIGDIEVPKGGMLLLAIGSANHDERVFAAPQQLDFARENNRHLSFGFGGHYCAGAPLARMEAAIAFGLLLERLPGLRLCVPADQLRWRSSPILRGLEAMWVTA